MLYQLGRRRTLLVMCLTSAPANLPPNKDPSVDLDDPLTCPLMGIDPCSRHGGNSSTPLKRRAIL